MSFLDADVKRPLASVSSIAEHAGFLLKRFEVGRDGKTAYERLRGKSAKVQGMAFAEGFLWKRKRAGGPLGKLTCMWEDGIYLGVKARTAEIIVENRNGVWLTRTVRRKPTKERWDRSNLEMVVAVPLAQKRRRPKDGWRTSQERSGGDGQGVLRKVWRQKSMFQFRSECTLHVRI